MQRPPAPSAPGRTPRSLELRKNLEEQAKAKEAAIVKQKEIWEALARFIERRGGYLTSPPHARPLVVQIPQFSELADELHDLGYDLTPAGSSTWITAGRFEPVNVFHFQIPLPR